ncbi:MAG: flagellar biosynthesis anti-sigma factor FlgM [Acidobacteriota bacterium]
MKIDGNNPYLKPEFQLQQREQASQQEKQKVQEQPDGPRDRLEFSVTGKELQYLSQKASEAPDVRSERVAEIKSQIEAGTYNIQAQEIAEAMITGSLIDKSV